MLTLRSNLGDAGERAAVSVCDATMALDYAEPPRAGRFAERQEYCRARPDLLLLCAVLPGR